MRKIALVARIFMGVALLGSIGTMGVASLAGAATKTERSSLTRLENKTTHSHTWSRPQHKKATRMFATCKTGQFQKVSTTEVVIYFPTSTIYEDIKAVTLNGHADVTFATTSGRSLIDAPTITTEVYGAQYIVPSCGINVIPAQTGTAAGAMYKLTVNFYSTVSLIHSAVVTFAVVGEAHMFDLLFTKTKTCLAAKPSVSTKPRWTTGTYHTSCKTVLVGERWTDAQINGTTAFNSTLYFPTTTVGQMITKTAVEITHLYKPVSGQPGALLGTKATTKLTASSWSIWHNWYLPTTEGTTTLCGNPEVCFDSIVSDPTMTGTYVTYTSHVQWATGASGTLGTTFTTVTDFPKMKAFTTKHVGYYFWAIPIVTREPTFTSITPTQGSTTPAPTTTVTVCGTTFTSLDFFGFGLTKTNPTWITGTTTPLWNVTQTGTTTCITMAAPSGTPGTVTVFAGNTPTVLSITGLTYTFDAPPATSNSGGGSVASTPTGTGYWVTAPTGGVFAYGGASTMFYGSLPGLNVKVNDISAMAVNCTHTGYWLAGKDGGVFSFGGAGFTGSLPQLGVTPYEPIVAIEPNSACTGYYLLGADGGVFAFGAATFDGSLPHSDISVSDAVGISVVTGGYFIVTADGGVFAFGSAATDFHGSLPGLGIHVDNVVGLVPTPTLGGYYLVSSDGGVFAFGNATYVGSEGGASLGSPVIGFILYPTTSDIAYALVTRSGTVKTFNKPFV